MRGRGTQLAACLAALVLTVSGCGGGHRASSASTDLRGGLVVVLTHGFRVYDPTGYTTGGLTAADIVRSSVTVVRFGGTASVNVGLTRAGRVAMCRLTRALAHRGAQQHHELSFVVAVKGRVYDQPHVDYHLFPNGICSRGLEFSGLRPSAAQKLAKLIRGG